MPLPDANAPTRGATILIVEDERIVALSLQDQLAAMGYTVVATADTGERAVELAVHHRPHLVLMDIRLRGAMDGVVAAELIRARLDTPVVFLTAYSTRDVIERAKVSEPYGYVLKPVAERELHVVIEMALYRHRTGRQLLAQKRLLESTLQSIGDGVIATDADWRVTFMNGEAERLTGRKAGECLGLRLERVLVVTGEHDVAPAEIPAALTDCTRPARQARRYALRRPEGGDSSVECTAAPICGDGGDVLGGVIVLRDVAERREAEEAVRRSTELLRAVVDNTSDAIFVKDRQGKYLLFNEAAARFVGRPVVDVIGRSDADLFEPESARRAADHDRRAMASGSALTGEEELTAAGVTRVYQATKAPYHDSSGNVLGVVGISRDVTDSKRAEEQLRLRDRAIRAVTQGILIADATRTGYPIVYVSPSFEKLTGYAAAEVVGRNCHFLQGPDTDPETVDRIRAALAAGQAFCAELLNYRRDGTPFWNELSISPVYDDGGRLTHFVGVQTDVTDRRRLEEQFRQSQKMESVGLLAGGIAHDFNNLLTIIGGYSRLLLREPLADEQMMMAREIWEAGERAATLTRQLLAFGRKQILAPEIVDLNAVVARAGRLLKRLIGEDVEVVFALNPAAEAARVDPAQLEQALINLAVNARDAMPAGGRLTISTGNVDVTQPHEFAAPGRYVRLAVTDTGCGMSDEVKARVFEPFFTTKGPGKGTGLGLSMVYGFVKQSGGYVTVASAPGTGTTFEILLPRTDRPEGTDTPAEPPPPPARAGDTILLVEDEEGVRKYMSSVLRRLGYVVYEAADGPSAVRASDEHIGPIHLLLTDVVMPSIGGRQLANTLAERRPGIKVLYTSGYTDDALLHHGVGNGTSNFLRKPFTAAELGHAVYRVLADESVAIVAGGLGGRAT